jgi:hypothetical protein
MSCTHVSSLRIYIITINDIIQNKQECTLPESQKRGHKEYAGLTMICFAQCAFVSVCSLLMDLPVHCSAAMPLL